MPDLCSAWWQLPLSDGEIHFLWSFMDGSIMNPDTRWRLRHAWGMCPRHSAGWLSMEATFRAGYLIGPAVLYEDLMERATEAFKLRGPGKRVRLAHRLRERGPCLMCELGYGPRSTTLGAHPWVLTRAREGERLRRFVRDHEPWWRPAVCGRCAGDGAAARCRAHLRDDLLGDAEVDLPAQRALVDAIFERVARFSRSFRWELRGTDTAEDRAALISAVGWCGGWQPWLWLAERELQVPGSEFRA